MGYHSKVHHVIFVELFSGQGCVITKSCAWKEAISRENSKPRDWGSGCTICRKQRRVEDGKRVAVQIHSVLQIRSSVDRSEADASLTRRSPERMRGVENMVRRRGAIAAGTAGSERERPSPCRRSRLKRSLA